MRAYKTQFAYYRRVDLYARSLFFDSRHCREKGDDCRVAKNRVWSVSRPRNCRGLRVRLAENRAELCDSMRQ
jgi:hypothetical protein